MVDAPKVQYELLPNAQLQAPSALPNAPQQQIAGAQAPRLTGGLPAPSARMADEGGMAQVAKVMTAASLKIMAHAREKAIDTAVVEAQTEFNQFYADTILDPETGMTSVKGKAAHGLFDSVGAAWDAKMKEMLDKYPPEARGRVQELGNSFRARANQSVAQYSGQELERYRQETIGASIVSTEQIAASSEDPTSHYGALEELLRKKHVGADDVAIQQYLNESKSRINTSKIEIMLAGGKDELAAQYISRLGEGELDPDVTAKFVAKITAARERRLPMESAMAVIRDFQPKSWDETYDIGSMLTSLKGRVPAEMYTQAANLVLQENNVRNATIQAKVDKMENSIYAAYNEGGYRAAVGSEAFGNLPAADQQRIDAKLRTAEETARKAAESKAEKANLTARQQTTYAGFLTNPEWLIDNKKVEQAIADKSLSPEHARMLRDNREMLQTPQAQAAIRVWQEATYGRENVLPDGTVRVRPPSSGLGAMFDFATENLASVEDTLNPWADLTDGHGRTMSFDQSQEALREIVAAAMAGTEKDLPGFAKKVIEDKIEVNVSGYIFDKVRDWSKGQSLAAQGVKPIVDWSVETFHLDRPDPVKERIKAGQEAKNIKLYAAEGYDILPDPNTGGYIAVSAGRDAWYSVSSRLAVAPEETSFYFYDNVLAPEARKEMVKMGNLITKPVRFHKMPDGKIATVRTIGVNVDGLEYVIPTVGVRKTDDGKERTYIMTNDEAINQFMKTGGHYGAYRTPEAAQAASDALHIYHQAFIESQRNR